MDERLHGRGGAIWQAYVGGRSQDAIGVEYGISQQRVSQILAEVRAAIPGESRTDAALLAVERANALIAAVWPAALSGDVKAVGVALRVMERTAKALGLDAQEPLKVVLERQLNLEGQLVADALAAALDVLGLSEEQRIAALGAAQRQLAGEGPPPGARPVQGPSGPSVPPSGGSVLEANVRRMLEEDGIDVDELLREVAEEEDGDGATGA